MAGSELGELELVQRRGQVQGNRRRDVARELKEALAIDVVGRRWQRESRESKGVRAVVVGGTRRPAPGRREEDDVCAQPWCNRCKVRHNKFDARIDAVQLGIVPRIRHLDCVEIDGNDVKSGARRSDGVAAAARKGVNGKLTIRAAGLHTRGDCAHAARRDRLWRHREPGFRVELYASVVAREESVALLPIFDQFGIVGWADGAAAREDAGHGVAIPHRSARTQPQGICLLLDACLHWCIHSERGLD